jgi:hypothetical protein
MEARKATNIVISQLCTCMSYSAEKGDVFAFYITPYISSSYILKIQITAILASQRAKSSNISRCFSSSFYFLLSDNSVDFPDGFYLQEGNNALLQSLESGVVFLNVDFSFSGTAGCGSVSFA